MPCNTDENVITLPIMDGNDSFYEGISENDYEGIGLFTLNAPVCTCSACLFPHTKP